MIINLDAISEAEAILKYQIGLPYEKLINGQTAHIVEAALDSTKRCCSSLFSISPNYNCAEFFGASNTKKGSGDIFLSFESAEEGTKIIDLLLIDSLINILDAAVSERYKGKKVTAYSVVKYISPNRNRSPKKKMLFALEELAYDTKGSLRGGDTASRCSEAANLAKKYEWMKKVPIIKEASLFDGNKVECRFAIPTAMLAEIRKEKLEKFLGAREWGTDTEKELNSLFQFIMNIGRVKTVENLYDYYLIEKLSGMDLFFNVLYGVFRASDYSRYNLLERDTIALLAQCQRMPNILTRKYFVRYALSRYQFKPDSNVDFWKRTDLDTVRNSALMLNNKMRGFQVPRWCEQYSLFINYISDFALPVVQWCLLCMITAAMGNCESENDVLDRLIEEIPKYMSSNLNAFANPMSELKKEDSENILEYTDFACSELDARMISFYDQFGVSLAEINSFFNKTDHLMSMLTLGETFEEIRKRNYARSESNEDQKRKTDLYRLRLAVEELFPVR